jgi:hypothetical protein
MTVNQHETNHRLPPHFPLTSRPPLHHPHIFKNLPVTVFVAISPLGPKRPFKTMCSNLEAKYVPELAAVFAVYVLVTTQVPFFKFV